VKAWYERVGEREAVQRGMKLGEELRRPLLSGKEAEEARKNLFGRRP
jgi:glutathione S-transferase/GST-like protein